MNLKIIVNLLVGFIVFGAGLFLGNYKSKVETQKIIMRLQNKLATKNSLSLEEVIDNLEKELVEKDSIIKESKTKIRKTEEKLLNLENQFSELLNSFMRESLSGEKEAVNIKKSIGSNEADLSEQKEGKKLPDDLIEEINSALEGKEYVAVVKLLKQLVEYGREYYQFVFDTLKKVSEDRGRIGRFNYMRLFRELNSPKFVDYYKWVIESSNIEIRSKMMALYQLISISGEDIKPYFFEQFDNQKDNIIRSRLFGLLSDSPEYKNRFIEVAKNMSEDLELRHRIILEYANDGSPEITALYNYLRVNEQDEKIKRSVNIISEARVAGEKGYVVLNNGEILKEKDIILKIGEEEVSPIRRGMIGPGMIGPERAPRAVDREENIELTIKRGGVVTTVTIPRSKFISEFRSIDSVYIGSR